MPADPRSLLDQGVTFGAVYLDAPAGTDLKTIPVDRLARADAHVFVWCGSGGVGAGEGLLRRWGFVPRRVLVAASTPTAGSHWQLVAEVLLFGARGRRPLGERGRLSWPAGGGSL